MFKFGNHVFVALVALTCFVSLSTVSAQNSDAEESLDDFIHYSLVANVEFAEAYAMSLLRDQMSDEEFYYMVTTTKQQHERFDRAIGWARFVTELEPLAAKLEERFEAGLTAVIRNADRLHESIGMLQGSTRQRLLAKDRLVEAGEYAVGPLLRSLDKNNDARNARSVRDMLTSIGRDAVLPLSAALPNLNDETQVLVSKTLGDIGYHHAAPSLVAVLQDGNSTAAVQHAAAQALGQLGIPEDTNLSTLHTIVAQQFYDGQTSVMPRAVDGQNIYWSWGGANGLIAKDVPQGVFDDVMAMHHAYAALSENSDNIHAMSVFVAANLRRDRELAGQDDLVYGDLAYSPAFYATVFGPEIAQHVLGKALADHDTSLALDAIAALARTAGESALQGNDQPIVSAMYYPDRRVQYESAMTLAATLPTNSFAGDYRVVPLLASAVRSGDEMFAIVIGDDEEARREMVMFLDRNGWNAVGEGTTAQGAIDQAGVVPGIDLAIVVARSAGHGESIVNELLALPPTTVTPVMVLSDGADLKVLSLSIGDLDTVETANIGISESAKLAVLEDLLAAASGGRLSSDEADAFAVRALAVLRDIALAQTALNVDDATNTLIDALTNSNAESQAVIAQTLAMVNNPLAQKALINEAMKDRDLEQRVLLLDYAAASVRHFGNLAEDWQIDGVIDLAENAGGYLADAAARLNGALNHPNTSVMMFLP